MFRHTETVQSSLVTQKVVKQKVALQYIDVVQLYKQAKHCAAYFVVRK